MSKCTIINAHITDQVLQLSNLPRIASGSKGALQIRCDFCGKWDGCGKTAVFYRDKSKVYHVPVLDNLVTVPWEVLADEGCFWFGIMGTDDLTRTTEAIRIEVAKGAITVATAVSDPTPDIYQQLMATYGVIEARLNEAIAMRSTGGALEYEYSSVTGDVYGAIKSNGTSAHFEVRGNNLLFGPTKPGVSATIDIPEALTPSGCVVTEAQGVGLEDFLVRVDPVSAGQVRVDIRYLGDSDFVLAPSSAFCGHYSLASVSIAELADARVGLNSNGSTTTYPTAGQAIREQVFGLHNRVGLLTDRVWSLEKNGTGGGGTGGGSGVLMVMIDENDVVSHTNAQIYEHYQNGCMVMADYCGMLFTLVDVGEAYAYFTRATDDPGIYALWLEDDGVGSYDEYYLSSGGGSNLLVVTLVDTAEGNKASCTPSQMLEHIQNGGIVLLNEDSTGTPSLFQLTYCDQAEAIFSQVYNDGVIYYYTVHEDGSYFDHNFAPASAKVIGDIDTALDAIRTIQKELIGVALITFTLDGVEYQAEEGMTWANWCDSEYNTKRIFYQSGYVYDENGDNIVHYDSDGERDVLAPDLIFAGGTYRVS